MEWFSELRESALRDLDIVPLLLNLVLVLLLGQALSLHYLRYSGVLSNKRRFAPILLFIAATTMLVISVVKTSLALSLGLVGALSIIRFRTPIKEPEELAYLFLSVALGIGLGADQRLPTTIMFLVILGAITLKRRGASDTSARTLLHVNADLGALAPAHRNADSALALLLEHVRGKAESVDLRRVDAQGEILDTSMILDLASTAHIGPIVAGIQQAFPGASVTVVESGSVD
jgi:hypothetical protein